MTIHLGETEFHDIQRIVPGTTKNYVSKNGKYELQIVTHKTGKHTWDYTTGAISYKGQNAPSIYVHRNYGDFWFAWVLDHPNGNDYLLCGEQYTGYTIVNLTKGTAKSYANQQSFCWYKAVPSQSRNLLAVEGCYWAMSPGSLRVYDFADPDAGPLPLLLEEDWGDEIARWEGDEYIETWRLDTKDERNYPESTDDLDVYRDEHWIKHYVRVPEASMQLLDGQ